MNTIHTNFYFFSRSLHLNEFIWYLERFISSLNVQNVCDLNSKSVWYTGTWVDRILFYIPSYFFYFFLVHSLSAKSTLIGNRKQQSDWRIEITLLAAIRNTQIGRIRKFQGKKPRKQKWKKITLIHNRTKWENERQIDSLEKYFSPVANKNWE